MASTDLMSQADKDRAYWQNQEAIYDDNANKKQLHDSIGIGSGIDYRYVKPNWKVEKERKARLRAKNDAAFEFYSKRLKAKGIRIPTGPGDPRLRNKSRKSKNHK